MFCFQAVYLPFRQLGQTNTRTFDEVRCQGDVCDVSELSGDWSFNGAEYLIERKTRFLVNTSLPAANFRGFPARSSDPEFMSRFRKPASFSSPSGESWRLYSVEKQVGSARIAVMVGYAERVAWKMDLPSPPADIVDEENVEFKRSLSFERSQSSEQVMQTIAVFLNSGDGTIFIEPRACARQDARRDQ